MHIKVVGNGNILKFEEAVNDALDEGWESPEFFVNDNAIVAILYSDEL